MKLIICLFLLCGVAQGHPEAKCNQTSMTPEDKAFLNAHNIRRERFHENYGVSYVPLKWSSGLKKESETWAHYLADYTCSGKGQIYHDPANRYGENIAGNYGSGSWAKRPLPDNILHRFVERELDKSDKGHLTQVLWRPTKYVGCAMVSAINHKNDKIKCHITVCRYAKPGNCNMGKFRDWETATYQDDSQCGPECPPEGCK